MKDQMVLEAIAERDVDLLVLEELHVSSSFRSWLLRLSYGVTGARLKFINAWHSLSDPTLGESDIVVLFRNAAKEGYAVLIENKINAPPRPEQARRYKARGKAGIERGEWRKFKTVILAPERYLTRVADAKSYDTKISYEAVKAWFDKAGIDSARHQYKSRMLQHAIEQNRRGYNPIIDERITQFFHSYWEYASRVFPEIGMDMPDPKSKGSNWICFHPKNLGKNRRLWHKMDVGNVDLEIKGSDKSVNHVKAKYGHIFGQDVDVINAGKSIMIRIGVPPLDLRSDFGEQLDNARLGMKAAYRLLYLTKAIQ